TVVGPGTAPYLVAELDYEDEAAFLATRDTPEQAAAAAHADTLPAGRVLFVGELRDTCESLSEQNDYSSCSDHESPSGGPPSVTSTWLSVAWAPCPGC
ncbi:MAG: hypothetical protein ACXVD1_12260, partial [Nocardioides sp.]